MRVRHVLHAVGICPSNGLRDNYLVTVYAREFISCEKMHWRIIDLLATPIFQEDFTQSLANDLGCKVKTTCRHLHGGSVLTDCICLPRKAV